MELCSADLVLTNLQGSYHLMFAYVFVIVEEQDEEMKASIMDIFFNRLIKALGFFFFFFLVKLLTEFEKKLQRCVLIFPSFVMVSFRDQRADFQQIN